MLWHLGILSLQAQTTPTLTKRCATHKTSPKFERWLQNKIQQRRKQRTHNELITIPVVVHVVHNGEPIGEGVNISKEQILSQIRVLNEDFRRKSGTPGFNLHPAGADVQIEFQLAVRTPEGLPTDGIVRVKGSQTNWGTRSAEARLPLKAHSFWNPAHYLNVWVANIAELGHGQFPVSDLPGVAGDTEAENPLDDGIIVDYQAFGTIGQVIAPHDQGRTATHEVGHYLGLIHIDGDGNCAEDDFCTDTPPVSFKTSGCPNPKHLACDGTPAQIENYLDYTDDRCMNMFTLQQKERMRTVLANSPRRKTLKDSPGLTPVVLIPNDASVEKIERIQTDVCNTNVTPQVLIRNMGTEVLTSLTITYTIDDALPQTLQWTGALQSLTTTSVALPTTQTTRGTHQIKVMASEPNKQTEVVIDRTQEAAFFVLPLQSLPLKNDFSDASTLVANWQVVNPDDKTTWEIVTLTDQENQVLKLEGFDYVDKAQEDILLTPILNNESNLPLSLRFKVSYAAYDRGANEVSQDALKVGVTLDCGKTFTIVYEKQGTVLATVDPTTDDWVPTKNTEWRTESINLSRWSNQEQVQIAFISVNDFGNNIYLDDISITSGNVANNPQDFVKITPNPGKAQNIQFSLQLPAAVDRLQWTLTSLTGQEITQGKIANAQFQSQSLTNQRIAAGIYLLKVHTPHYTITKRVIVY